MFDPATLPKRSQDFHAGNAGDGTRNREAFEAGCQCRDSGATEGEALAYVEAGATRCGLDLREARDAVRSAFKQPPREPITKGHGGTNGNGYKSAPLSRPPRPPVSAAAAATTKTPAAAETPGKRRVVARYDYTEAAGGLRYQVERTDPKGFRQRRPDGNGGFVWGLSAGWYEPSGKDWRRCEKTRLHDRTTKPTASAQWFDEVPRTLYRLPKLAAAQEIIITEGERDVETLEGLGFTATTNSGGAGNWPPDHAAHFAGKRVVIIPDADPPGQEHAEAVARELHGVAESVRVLRLPEGVKDVTAYAETFSDTAELAERLSLLAEGAAVWQPKPEADTKPEPGALPAWTDAAAFLAVPKPAPPEIIGGVLHRGCKMVIGGSSKSRKSWVLLDLALAVATGSKWLDFPTSKARVCFGNFELPEFAIHHRLKVIAAARGITIPPDALTVWNLRGYSAPYETLLPTLAERISGADFGLIILDPSYKMLGGADENSARDIALLCNGLERFSIQTGAAICFTSHFAKGNASGKDAQDRISGSGVFARDPDAIVTLTALETPDAYAVEAILRTMPPVEPLAIRWEYPVFTVADELDPADLKQPKRGNVKTTPTAEEVLSLFPTTADKPREGLLTAVELRAAFDGRGWDRTSAPAVRDRLVAAGKLAIHHGAHNCKLTGRKELVDAYGKQLAEAGTVLEQTTLPTTARKRKSRR